MKATGWVVVQPIYNHYGSLKDIKLSRITQNPPTSLSNGERAFRLSVEIPESVFDPFANVQVTVPESDVISPEVEIG